MADTDTDSDGAYVERLAEELGAMLLPQDYERLVGMARRAEAAGRLRAALADCLDVLGRLGARELGPVTRAAVDRAVATFGEGWS